MIDFIAEKKICFINLIGISKIIYFIRKYFIFNLLIRSIEILAVYLCFNKDLCYNSIYPTVENN